MMKKKTILVSMSKMGDMGFGQRPGFSLYPTLISRSKQLLFPSNLVFVAMLFMQ